MLAIILLFIHYFAFINGAINLQPAALCSQIVDINLQTLNCLVLANGCYHVAAYPLKYLGILQHFDRGFANGWQGLSTRSCPWKCINERLLPIGFPYGKDSCNTVLECLRDLEEHFAVTNLGSLWRSFTVRAYTQHDYKLDHSTIC